jgi:hypothetical protein
MTAYFDLLPFFSKTCWSIGDEMIAKSPFVPHWR